MFELEKTPAKLASVNARAEIHGEKRVPAFDLKFEIEADNGILAHFAPDLRSALYKRPEDQQDMIDPERLSVLKYPGMSGFKWDLDGKGYTLVEEDQVGKLCSLIQQTVEITLTPPAPNTIGELFGDDPQQEPETADEE